MIRRKTLEILEILSEIALDSLDLFIVITTSGGIIYKSKIEYELRKIKKEREKTKFDFKQKHRVYSLISKLKKEGLLERKHSKLFLTKKGRELLINFKNKIIYKRNYQRNVTKQSTIVIFDIPEKERLKRAWLRSVLSNLGFRMLQKSVWIGDYKIPKEFIEDLGRLSLLNKVEIFTVMKRGTI